ncbi:MAG: hypothetical protein IJ814_00235 [Paludibacteraceae bacterium]|nr:hypothetical protein [Paludibacteraceae bacterium]
MKKLDIIQTIKDGVSLALVNYLSIVCAVALYVITIWIPYLNVGTTIAMASLPAEMAKGNVINPLFIFDGKYRRNMGEFFILISLMYGAIGMGFLFMYIPGIVLGLAFSLATVLFVDQDRPALEALRESNNLTYGNKWRIFCAEALLAICLCVAVAIINALFSIGNLDWLEAIGAVIAAVLAIFAVPAFVGVEAVIYKTLALDKDEEPAAPASAPAAKPAPAAPAPAAPAAEAAPEAEKPAKKRAPRKAAPKAE